MRPKIKNIILEPRRFFGDLWQVISWPKVIGFLIVVVFFVNIGIFIYDKKNPPEVESYAMNKVKSPYTEENHEDLSANGLFGTPRLEGDGNSVNAPLDAEGVFSKKTSKEDSLPPIAKMKMLTSSQQESVIAGDTVFLSATDSYDPDGTVKEYRWDFDQSNGLGIDAEGVNTTVKYNNPGVYTVTLIVIDDTGKESTTSMSISVSKKEDEKPNSVVQGLTTNQIDIDSLNFMSRQEVQNALETSYADFTSESYTMLAQSIYNSQKKRLPSLPSLADIELTTGKEATNTPPVIDSVNPKDGNKIFELRPIISAGFYGNNEVDTDGIEMTVDGKPVTFETMKTKFGVQFRPTEELGYGEHSVMLMVPDVRGLKTVKSWSFKIVDPKSESEDMVPKYDDKQGPRIIMSVPDSNSKHVKPNSDIRISFDEPVKPETVEVAVVDLSTNITKFFTKNQIQVSSAKTEIVINSNENIFDYDRAYQIVTRQEDELGNKSAYDWYVLGEEYGAPEFKITSPSNDSSSNKPQITVTGFADPTHSIVVGDVIAMVDANGAWKADINLEKGKNEILIKAKDLKGRESSQYLIVTYDPKANGGNPILDTQDSPVIMDASIRDKQVISKVRPQISFVYADTDGIDRSSVKLIVDGEDVTAQSFIAADSITHKPLKELKQGEHSVELVVADTTGKTTNYKMSFTVDAYPDQPNGLNASLTNNNENVLLIWDGVTNITNPEYRVYRSTRPNVSATAGNEVKRGLTSSSWIDTDVIDGTTYYYVVAAVTKDGNVSDASNEFEIRVDFSPPPLQILEPEKNFVTQKDKVTIKGATEKGSTVELFVNFVSVGKPALTTSGTFEQEVSLIPGDNIITTVATDVDGNESIDVRTVTYKVPDVDAPYPDIPNGGTSPMGTDVKINENIVVTYNEKINPESVKLTLKRVDNKENVIPVNMTDIALQISKDGKTITYNPRTDLDFEARYRVEVYAEDLAGNESINDDWEFETTIKAAPELSIVTPEQDFFVDKTDVYVSGKTEKNVDIKIRVTTTGGEAEPATPVEYNLKSQPDGTFKQLVKLYPYKKNVITVIATDHLGHSSMKVVSGLCNPPDTERPLLLINSPTSNSTVGTSTVNVVGQTEPTARITINVNGAVQQDFDMKNGEINFSKPITLNGGQNLIQVIATDKSGNKEVVALTVMFDNIKPLLDLANPVDGLTTNQSRVEVRGMSEATGVTVTLTLNSEAPKTLSVLPDGTFNEYVFLKTGNNYIVVRGRDEHSNETTIVRTVYYDPVKGVGGASGSGVSGAGADSDSVSSAGTDSASGGNNQNSSSGGTVSGQSTNDSIDRSTGDQKYYGGDNSAPKDVTVSPNHGSETNDSSQKFQGTTEPEANVTTTQNGKEIIDGKSDVNNGGFGTDVTLEEGKNIFITNATDASGNRKSDLTVVTLDTKGPATTVLAPKANSLTNESQVTVYGSTEPNTRVKVSLDGDVNELTSDELGYYTTKINTGDNGKKNVVVEAFDKLGNKTTKLVPIEVDKTAPSLSLASVNDVSLSGKTSSSPNGSSVSVASVVGTIKGKTEPNTSVVAKSNGRMVGTVKSDQNGDFRVDVAFQSGESSNIVVIATDAAGNERPLYFVVNADKEPPIVQVYAPNSTRNISSGSATISGVVKDDSTPVTIVIGLNAKPSVKTISGVTGSFNTTIGGLVKGTNTIHVTATDAVGNTSTQTLSAIYDQGKLSALRAEFNSFPKKIGEDPTYWNWSENIAKGKQGVAAGGQWGGFGEPVAEEYDPEVISMFEMKQSLGDIMLFLKDSASRDPALNSPFNPIAESWSSAAQKAMKFLIDKLG